MRAMDFEGADAEQIGASDIDHLSWKSLLDGFACTECGRCTAGFDQSRYTREYLTSRCRRISPLIIKRVRAHRSSDPALIFRTACVVLVGMIVLLADLVAQ